jgi:hypothetical protein
MCRDAGIALGYRSLPTVTPSATINHMDKFNYPAVCDKTPATFFLYCSVSCCRNCSLEIGGELIYILFLTFFFLN